MDSCDILVVGEGIDGSTAAIAASARGANVLMIEKAPKDVPHANTAFSGGSFRRTSQAYPAEKFYQDMIRLSGGRADPELTKLMVEESRQARLDCFCPLVGKGEGDPRAISESGVLNLADRPNGSERWPI